MRPPSIIWFERLFLASIAIGVVNSFLIYGAMEAVQPMPPALLIGSIGIGTAINVTLWYFAARRASNVARIILTVLFALGLASLAFSVMVGTYPAGTAGLLGGLSWVLQTAAIVFVYRPDANAWFRGSRIDDLGETFE